MGYERIYPYNYMRVMNDYANPTTEPKAETAEVIQPFNQVTTQGHGRLPHSAYTNTIDHQLSWPDLS
tara:strand:- start:2462 stop:2662 length:201 start_codon:yes stop_codon:yes gene_type:complete